MLTYSKTQWSTQDIAVSENSDRHLFYFYFVLQQHHQCIIQYTRCSCNNSQYHYSHILMLYCRWFWDPNVVWHNSCWTIKVATHKSLKMTWRNHTLNSGETKTSSSPSESSPLLTGSTIPRNFLFSCSCSLFAWISVLKHLDSSLNESKPLHLLQKLVNVQLTACKLTELALLLHIHMWYDWQGIHYILIFTVNNFHFYNKRFTLTFPWLWLDHHNKNKNPSLII